MAYQYRAQTRNQSTTQTNKGSHYINLSFTDGAGEIRHIRNKFISLKDTNLEDNYLISQYELSRKEWELDTSPDKPETFKFAVMLTANIVPAVTERAAPVGRMLNVMASPVIEEEKK